MHCDWLIPIGNRATTETVANQKFPLKLACAHVEVKLEGAYITT